jgi:xanthine dehydrogenase molybdenum-binding subunit
MSTSIKKEKPYRIIGTTPIRHDGYEKVTGKAKYGADTDLPGMIYGKILRSPHAHANIVSINTKKAESIAGVKAIVTAKDFPLLMNSDLDFSQVQRNPRMIAENTLAKDKVLYIGHAIAAVAANNPAIAEEAIKLIEVEYEILPAVINLKDAMKKDAPLLHDNLTTIFREDRFSAGQDTGEKSNIAGHIQFQRGDIEKGFKEADLIIEKEFNTETVHQGYIEPFASTADWNSEGRLTIWTCTQGSFNVRSSTANILDIPESTIKVVPTEIGGGFGGKGVGYLEPVAAVLSKKSGLPVKIIMTRKEVFEGTGPTSATYSKCKIGITLTGYITAAYHYMAYEAGAFPGSPVGGGAMTSLGPYKIENFLVDGYDVVCNKQKVQAYRAPGQPTAAFAVECIIDEIAEKLQIDPMELRLKNVARKGDRMPSGPILPEVGTEELEKAMLNHPHYNTPLEGPNRGRGVAVGFRSQAGGTGSSATLNVNSNGTVNIVTGSIDLSGTRLSLAMQAAEVLGLNAEDINPSVVDTDSVGWTGGTGGSRITFDTGLAVISAAHEVIKQMSQRAAILWEAKPEDIKFENGKFSYEKDSFTFKQLSGKLLATGGPVTCSASDTQGGLGPVVAGNIIDVEVDPETGKVDILRCTAFIDAGTAMQPDYVDGQVQGATAQGIGWALNEEFFYTEDGTIANATLLDYRMPTSLDLPMIESVIVEVPNPRHPFGVRGVGEAPIIPPLPAVANAVSNAIKVRMTNLPLTPYSILKALNKI